MAQRIHYFTNPLDEVYYRWYYMIEDGPYFTQSMNIKGNGLYGWNLTRYGNTFPGVMPADGTNVFSLRASTASPNYLSNKNIYLYSYNLASKDLPWGMSYPSNIKVNYQANRWTCVEIYLKANTVGQNNGVMRLWVDNVLVSEETGVTYRLLDSMKIKAIHNIYKEKTTTDAELGGITRWEDNIVVAGNRVGCM